MRIKNFKLYAILAVIIIAVFIFVFRGEPVVEDPSLLDANYSFTDPIQITSDSGKDENPSILLGVDGKFYMAWSSNREGSMDIWMKQSPDGVTWSDPWQVTNTAENDLYPSLIQGKDGIFHLAWQRNDLNASNRLNIWYGYSRDGKTWDVKQQVTKSDVDDRTPTITFDDNNRVVIAWSSSRAGQQDIYISFLDPAGWRDPIQITANPGTDTHPFLFKRQGTEYGLVWNRQPANTANVQALFAVSANGETWSNPTVLLENEAARNLHPMIYLCGFGYCGAWSSDINDSAGDIYFANLSAPNNAHRATAFVNRSDGYPRLTPAISENTWLMVWVTDTDSTDIFSRFIRVKN